MMNRSSNPMLSSFYFCYPILDGFLHISIMCPQVFHLSMDDITECQSYFVISLFPLLYRARALTNHDRLAIRFPLLHRNITEVQLHCSCLEPGRAGEMRRRKKMNGQGVDVATLAETTNSHSIVP